MFIGIDCGTQGTKALLWDGSHVLAKSYREHRLVSDGSGKREQNPDEWVVALEECILEVLAKSGVDGKQVQAMSVSGQQHGLVVLDCYDQIIRPAKLWCDTQTVDSFERFRNENSIEFAVELGIHVPVAFTIAKLAWLKEVEEHNFSKITKVLLPHDYLNFYLTGQYTSEAGDASGSGYFDTKRRSWSYHILDKLGMPDAFRFPELIKSHHPIGCLKRGLAEKLGLSSTLIIASGGGDNMMSAIGSGNVEEGVLTISLGTSGTAFSYSCSQIEATDYPDINTFCSSNGGYLPLVSTMNVTSAVHNVRSLFDMDLFQSEQAVANSPIGAGGIRVFPYFSGARLPNIPKAKGGIEGITSDNLSRENILRATLEGITINLCNGIRQFNENGLHYREAVMVGGGAANQVWKQIFSSVLSCTIKTPIEKETGAFGAALQAQWCFENNNSSTVLLSDITSQAIQFEDVMIHPNDLEKEAYEQLIEDYNQRVSVLYS
jgi:xylulokinase